MPLPYSSSGDIAGTASMRTIGTGGQQAAAGNHTHAGVDTILALVGSDVGPISSSTSLHDITPLGLAITSSVTEIWFAQWWLLVNAANVTMDVKIGFSVPSGCTMKWGSIANAQSYGSFGTTASGTNPVALATEGTTINFGTAAGVAGVGLVGVTFGGGTSGTVQIQYAQATSDSGNLKIDKGSVMRAQRTAT